MSFDTAFETFGIPGVIALGLGYVAYRIYQKYSFSIASYDMLNKYNPQKTLEEIWENGEQSKSYNHNWCKYYYGKMVDLNGKPVWEINLPAVENGNIYIYTTLDELPPGLDDGKYFFMVKIRNLKPHTKVYFQRKCFGGSKGNFIVVKYKRDIKDEIIGNGVHYFEPKSSIGEECGEGDDIQTITKEQIGLYIKAEDDHSIKDLVIEEAYIGKKYWKYNLLPYLSDKWYLLVEPRKTETN